MDAQAKILEWFKVDLADVNTAPQQLTETMQRDRSTESRLPIVKPV